MNSAAETEGVVKFNLIRLDGPAPPAEFLREVLIWRAVLFRLGLTGQQKDRYGGLAYGNLSQRLEGDAFAISGTQTGGKPRLTPEDFCVIRECDVRRNRVHSIGMISPSSEALTHAAAYQANAQCQSVIHVHSPELWHYFKSQGLSSTSSNAPYGSLEMAQEAGDVARNQALGAFAMLGHQDGIMAFGQNTESAAACLLRYLGCALARLSGA